MSKVGGNRVGQLEVPAPLAEVMSGFGSSDPDSGQADFAHYRQLGSSPSDISPLSHMNMQKAAIALYRTNPLAYRLVKLLAAFSASGAVRFEAENRKVQKALNDHWNHPLNNWEYLFYQCILELGLYGEVFLTANVLKNGDVTWGHINPLRVSEIIPDERDKSTPAKIKIRQETGEGEKILDIIRYDGSPQSKTHGFRTGQVFYARINGIRDSLRGISDLLPLIDYLDGLDQFMFSLQQRVSHQNNYIWDVTLDGMSQTEIDIFLASLHGKSPRPGAIRAHNERVTWQAIAPTFASDDASEHVRTFKDYIVGGAGLASWVVGDMSSANRAATENSAAVIAKTMEQRQREARGFLESIFNFVIDSKLQAGSLPRKRLKRGFFISMPKIAIRDFQRVANALRQGAEGIVKLVEADLIDPERGKRLAEELLNQLDLEGGAIRKERELLEGDDDEYGETIKLSST